MNPFEVMNNRRKRKAVLNDRVKGSTRDVSKARAASAKKRLRLAAEMTRSARENQLIDRRIDEPKRFEFVRQRLPRPQHVSPEEELPVKEDKEDEVEALDADFAELSKLLQFRKGPQREDDGYDAQVRQVGLERRARATEPVRSAEQLASRALEKIKQPVGFDQERVFYSPLVRDDTQPFVELIRRLFDELKSTPSNAVARHLFHCAFEDGQRTLAMVVKEAGDDMNALRFIARLPPGPVVTPAVRRGLLSVVSKPEARVLACELQHHLQLTVPELRLYVAGHLSPPEGDAEEEDRIKKPPPRSDLKKLKRQVKREHRAAMRELRRDSAFITATRQDEASTRRDAARKARHHNLELIRTSG